MSECKLLLVVPPYLAKRPDAIRSKMKSFLAFPYGVLCLASYVRQHAVHDHPIRILDLNTLEEEERAPALTQVLMEFSPDVVGLSLMFDVSYKHVAELSRAIKDVLPACLTLMGGAVVTTSWALILGQQPLVDALCYSEGETALAALLDAEDKQLELSKDPWITRDSMAAGRTPNAILVEKLDDFIPVDYSLVDITRYGMLEAFSPFQRSRDTETRQFFIVTSRGCPFKCVFCSEPTLHGGNMRYAGLDVIEDHLKYLVEENGMNVLTIYDDQLLLNHQRAKALFRILAKFDLRVETPNGLTVAYIDDEMAALMKDAGVDTVQLAVEAGTEYMLREVIRKPLRLDQVAPVVEILHKNNLFVQGFFVIGIPGERDQDRSGTVQFIKDVGLDWSGFSLAMPVRGSELHNICVKNGYIPDNLQIGEYEFGTYIIRSPGIDSERLPETTYRMNLDVNFVNNRRMRANDYEVAIRCFEDVIERYKNHAFAHYFLAKAQEKSGYDHTRIQQNMNRYHEILAQDPSWRKHAAYFGLG